MTTKMKVIHFCYDRMSSKCDVLSTEEQNMYVGQTLYVDLTVNADFGEMHEKELVGKVVEVDRFQPLELIGIGVKVVK